MSPSLALRGVRAHAVRTIHHVQTARHFGGSALLRSGKEDELHSENRAAVVEKKKQEQLKNAGNAEWGETLASNSESIIKAERGETKSTEEHIKELQKEAEQIGKK